MYPRDFPEEYYDAVHVFMVDWDVDREEGWLEEQRKQTSRLEAVFRDGHGYVTHRHNMGIYDGCSAATLSQNFKELTDGLDEKTLIIFFYAGRGTLLEPALDDTHDTPDLLMYCRDKDGRLCAPVSFDNFRENCVANLKNDVLIFLDCCYATTAELGSGSKEVIAASGKDRTSVQGKQGFTANIATLPDTARRDGRDSTTSLLFTDLVRRNFLKDPDADPAESPPVTLMKKIPLHAPLNKGQLPIVLAPVGRRLGDGESRQPVHQNLLWRKDISIILEVQFERGDVTAKFGLVHQLTGSLGEDHYWMGVCHRYRAPSQVLFIEVPLAVWYCLQPDPAIRFICIDAWEMGEMLEMPRVPR
ncbi:hypothetical protein PG993_002310 [Apiospora rasikravindrae]|uniref:Peptidase C14 caspase domain-containing protein n=1 Tax=Apiospora rasikravindrae TaxID=990691 RepID=A0ABR1TW99_9PEZI